MIISQKSHFDTRDSKFDCWNLLIRLEPFCNRNLNHSRLSSRAHFDVWQLWLGFWSVELKNDEKLKFKDFLINFIRKDKRHFEQKMYISFETVISKTYMQTHKRLLALNYDVTKKLKQAINWYKNENKCWKTCYCKKQ